MGARAVDIAHVGRTDWGCVYVSAVIVSRYSAERGGKRQSRKMQVWCGGYAMRADCLRSEGRGIVNIGVTLHRGRRWNRGGKAFILLL